MLPATIAALVLSILHVPPLLTVISPVNVFVAAPESFKVPEILVVPETVKALLPDVRSAPELTVNIETVATEFNVTPRGLLLTTPPVPVNDAGNSRPDVCAALPLYCKVAPAP